ncbi:hypothetical protein ABE099_09965 [Paenibacillus turicensis]|uniref:hypothetical protein n=1 Tax=Paenibacillus turicensis TaxID=160487 RepID=UPI003D2BE85A
MEKNRSLLWISDRIKGLKDEVLGLDPCSFARSDVLGLGGVQLGGILWGYKLQ